MTEPSQPDPDQPTSTTPPGSSAAEPGSVAPPPPPAPYGPLNPGPYPPPQGPPQAPAPPPRGRGLAWTAVILGALFLLGGLSSLANGPVGTPGDAAATAGEVAGRLFGLGLCVWAIIWGVRRLRRH